VLELLEREALPFATPRVVAADHTGERCGVPALLLRRLPGRPPDGRVPVEGFAAALEAIHALPPCAPAYARYYDPAEVVTPGGALWERALEVAAMDPPPYAPAFIHRDFNPGNTLWEDGALTGVIDWTQASTGPPGVDYAHLRVNLALAGEDVGAGDDPWWDVAAVVDIVPELDVAAARRLEPFVAAALAELGLS
jgi:aminoglycoside phosphotransferase (APT) family kinase protein